MPTDSGLTMPTEPGLGRARLAVALAARLNEHELYLNARLVEAAGLLHDIARLQPDHARAGAALLSDLGYRRVAVVAAQHMDLQPEVEGENTAETLLGEGSASAGETGAPSAEAETLPGEAEVLYLADKLVAESDVVSLSERLATRLRDLAAEPAAQARARERLGRASALARVVETIVGEPAESVARRALTGTP